MKAVLTAVLVAICVANATAQDIKRSVIEPGYVQAPADLSKIVAYTDTIIVGKVLSQTQETEQVGDQPNPLINHKVEVIEVVKSVSPLAQGAVISVKQLGGTGRVGNNEITINDHDFPVFLKGSTYIFFLNNKPGFFVAQGPATVLPVIDSNHVLLPKAAESVTELRGHRQDSLANMLTFLRTKVLRTYLCVDPVTAYSPQVDPLTM